MEYSLLGWPSDGPTLSLDHEHFAYAGKFVIPRTGKAVAREDGVVVAAAAFDADRTDDDCLRIRYVTVRDDRRDEGIGSRLLRFVVDRAHDRGYDEVKAGVNNPLAYEAFYRAGLAYTGETTGLAELVCSTASTRTRERYQAGLGAFRERDLTDSLRSFLDACEDCDPPPVVDSPAES
ncbi:MULTISPECIES: GNAT family N-acetyltransferase [unclassified Halorhabdus]|uniref:GNAT family N-acetyltransferase n=1 Tax=unclassified Halorhabdus TaxID=2621901 RepID=UPI0023D9D805|nr:MULTISPECIES: GNAT family N-acetyltransferase [unclassified Halorhabdus]WEL18212.1 Acetyltransferase (GNAT) family [Halorhabdus sp. SVX81]WEL22092.1 Acetyltransferase (GNAT) family [Halorhabdus sp. BNX81]